MYTVLASRTFKKQFNALDKKMQKRIKSALKQLEKDPYKPRSGADIKPIIDTTPQKHRIRVGNYRIVYGVENDIVKVIEGFWRGRGY